MIGAASVRWCLALVVPACVTLGCGGTDADRSDAGENLDAGPDRDSGAEDGGDVLDSGNDGRTAEVDGGSDAGTADLDSGSDASVAPSIAAAWAVCEAHCDCEVCGPTQLSACRQRALRDRDEAIVRDCLAEFDAYYLCRPAVVYCDEGSFQNESGANGCSSESFAWTQCYNRNR